MAIHVFLAVLLAALLHASWNALVKSKGDKTVAIAAVTMGQGLCALALVGFVPRPTLESLPYLALGAAFHIAYRFALANAYRLGDLTQVYPLARGSGPLIVALASFTLIGEPLGPLATVGVVLITAALFSLALTRGAAGLRNPLAAGAAVLTGCFIAGYSIADGLGARIAGTPHGFWVWLSLADSIVFLALIALLRGRRALWAQEPGFARTVVLGGGASFLAYWIVVWAFTMAPIAAVTALRETSIIFALLIGVFFLREPLNLARVFAILATVAGAALVRLGR